MLKKLILALVVFIILAFPTVYAQDSVNQGKPVVIRDEKKLLLANRLNEKLTALNKQLVEQLTAKLTRLKELLAKLEDYTAALAGQGANIEEVENMIIVLKQDFEAFEADLAIQATKNYTPSLTDENNLHSLIGAQYQLLNTDLKAQRNTLRSIKEQMIKTAHLLVNIKQLLSVTPMPTSGTPIEL